MQALLTTLREPRQDRRQDGAARSVRHDPAHRGGGSMAVVRGDPKPDRRSTVESSADMTLFVIAVVGL